jgi:DNA-binding NtrC family response regulator
MEQRILAIDDEPHMLMLLERIVQEKTPYRIATTSNSLMVPELLEQAEYDLLITDLKMPGLDGLDLLHHLREKDRPEELIIITAFGSLESAIEAMSQGVFDYITKPFKKEQLLFTIDRAMRWQQLKKESRRVQQMLLLEPYDKASMEFRREYVHSLAQRTGSAIDEITARSGLDRGEVERILQEDK